MLILGRDQLKDPSLGYARTFARQVEDCLGLALERGVRIVSNAGGLNPAGLAARISEVAAAQGLSPSVAYVDGDDVRSTGVRRGADGERLPRRLRHRRRAPTAEPTSSSPAGSPTPPSWSGRRPGGTAGARRRTTSWPAPWSLATCWSAGARRPVGTSPGSRRSRIPAQPLGFPLAEVAADGSSVITKHDGTGGLVSLDTVTAQLMYEVQSTEYLGPDVTTHLDSIRLTDEGPDRVRVSGVRGSAPPERLKVCVNELGGHRNSVELVLTGLDLDEKAAWVRAQLEPRLDRRLGHVDPRAPAGRRRRHRGRRVDPAPVHRPGPEARAGRPCIQRGGRRARARVVPGLHDDRAARQRNAVRRLPRRVRRPRARPSHRASR